ncbi:MAG: TIR domain-containing protein [Burkholderiales bacterium]
MSETMRVFVASSSEQIAVARGAAGVLDSPPLSAKVWDEEVFDFSDSYIESLETELDRADFAVVILTADDSANVRNKTVNLPRDNVIFELGLFTGRLGRKRCYFLIDGNSDTQVASDLSGVNSVKFYRNGAANEAGRFGLTHQLERLRTQMLQRGVRYKPSPEVRRGQEALWRFSRRVAGHWWERMRAGEDDKSALSYVAFGIDETTNTPQLHGWAYDSRGEPMADWRSVVTGAILGDQPSIHYRWEGEHDQQHGQVFGGGGEIKFDDDELLTASGYFYDTNFALVSTGASTRVKHFGLYRCDHRDEEIMSKRWSDAARQLVRERIASVPGR